MKKESSILYKYKKQISYLSYMQLFSPILTFLFVLIIYRFCNGEGYGLGVLIVTSIPMALIFGVASILLDFRIKYKQKINQNFLNLLKAQTIFIIPSIIHWILLIYTFILEL